MATTATPTPPNVQKQLDNGLQLLTKIRVDEVQVGATPKDLVFEIDKVRLFRYRPLADKAADVAPVLVAYGMVGRYTMADLQPDRSLIRKLLAQGLTVSVVDWGNPNRADRWLSFEDYVEDYVGGCVQHILREHGIASLNLRGICEGGVLTMCYAPLHPAEVRNLILTITPVDFHADRAEARRDRDFVNLWTRSVDEADIERVSDSYGYIPGKFMGLVFSADEAVALVHDGDTIAFSGFVGIGTPEALIEALQRRFAATAQPRDLSLVFAAAPGDGKDRGLNRLDAPGLVKRAVGGHWSLVPRLAKLALDNRIQAWNLPLGTMSQLFRDIAGHRAGVLTKTGLHTFVDPRLEGGRINARSTDALVELVMLAGEEWLLYKAFPIKVAFLRGTTADTAGNITMEREALTLDNLALATAAHNSGGLVVVQVERTAALGTLSPRQVHIPGVLVDCVVVAPPEQHTQTFGTAFSPAFSSELRVPLDEMPPLALDERKIIGRRCAFELPMGGVVNLGIGMPEALAGVANEERVLSHVTLTAEPGVIGGMPQGGADVGAAVNTDALLDQNRQFDFYDGGGLDLACLGMAQVDVHGHVNVSRFGARLAGAGGFINISQNARRLVLAGTFTAGGLKVAIEDGALRIVQEGRERKFVRTVQQITFNGRYAHERGQPVLYVTERCVFRLGADGLELTEVAPGIDIERDILAHMDFAPRVDKPATMDTRIFRDEPMQLADTLLQLELDQRVAYDAARDTLFVNWENLNIRSRDDVDRIRRAVEVACEKIGHKVALVANYDNCRIDRHVADTHAAMVRYLQLQYYRSATRYSTSAFLRAKLGEALTRRQVSPQIFESGDDAAAFTALRKVASR